MGLAYPPKPLSQSSTQLPLERRAIHGAWLTARPLPDRFSNNQGGVYSELLPVQKLQKVAELIDSGRKVAMLGDGINDALVLTKATVRVAMGSGTDVARESVVPRWREPNGSVATAALGIW